MATTLRDSLLPMLDVVRGIPGALGLRLYTVSVVQRSWSGSTFGQGTNTDVTTGLKIDLGIYPVKVRQLTERDVVASGGLYSTQDIEVGPITPPFSGSGRDNDAISVFDPPVGTNAEIFFNVTGPGMASGGSWFKKIGQDVSKPLRYMLTLRRTSEIP